MAPIFRTLVSVLLLGAGIAVASPGCADQGVGDPCTPGLEFDPSFLGFDANSVTTESNSYQCRTRLCLVNHFQGRTTCPYGQDTTGVAPPGASSACTIPGSSESVTGLKTPNDSASFADPIKKALVQPQCKDRSPDRAVYCSCRCADINGERPSNQTFCECPDGFTCRLLVTSTGIGNEGLTGSYCVKNDTEFNRDTSCKPPFCDPKTNSCGN